jgi:uncharacterized membrane protein (UPF0127 family)
MSKRLVVYAVIAVCIAALGAAFVWQTVPTQIQLPQQSQNGLRTIMLDGQTIRVSIADTDAARQLGLGGRAGLAPDEGMLFIFPQDGVYSFWMKDMRFSIDMIWLSSGGAVTYMAQNVSPDTYPKAFGPNTPARYVLELPAGYAKEHTVKIGDIAQF